MKTSHSFDLSLHATSQPVPQMKEKTLQLSGTLQWDSTGMLAVHLLACLFEIAKLLRIMGFLGLERALGVRLVQQSC